MTPQTFHKIKKLYHYTNRRSACLILADNTLLFGLLRSMNDINELYRPVFLESDNDYLRAKVLEEINRYQQISLTIDDDSNATMGFDIPAMWGHYGEKGNGVCLVLDFEKVEVLLRKDESLFYREIAYRHPDDFNSSIIVEADEEFNCFSSDQVYELFFNKTKDWSYEQEYRILTRSNSRERRKLDISNAIVAAIICNDSKAVGSDDSIFGSETFNKLKEHINPNQILAYGSFINHRVLVDQNGDEYWCSVNREGWDIDI